MEKSIAHFSYSTKNYLGKGSYSNVYEGVNNHTREKVAIKIIDKNILKAKSNYDNVQGEI